MSNNSILPIDRNLSGTTTPDQSGPGSNGNEKVLYISQSFNTGASPSDCFVSYPGHLLQGVGGSYPSAEMQLVYSTALTNWAIPLFLEFIDNLLIDLF